MNFSGRFVVWATAALLCAAAPAVHAAEHVTLTNGFELDCARQEPIEGGRVRLYLFPPAGSSADKESNYMDVEASAVSRVETVPDPVAAVAPVIASRSGSNAAAVPALTHEELQLMLAKAGAAHDIDKDLLASVVKAESGGRVNAVSRTGARGLMQLMPGTASEQGVEDAFKPDQNVAGGTAYLDQLLTRYHDSIPLALAAYNAGPGAVDKYHGIPPYRETRAYVARVIREFNRRKLAATPALLATATR